MAPEPRRARGAGSADAGPHCSAPCDPSPAARNSRSSRFASLGQGNDSNADLAHDESTRRQSGRRGAVDLTAGGTGLRGRRAGASASGEGAVVGDHSAFDASGEGYGGDGYGGKGGEGGGKELLRWGGVEGWGRMG